MTRVYFVRHAQPEHDWKEDRTRPLTEEGKVENLLPWFKDVIWSDGSRNVLLMCVQIGII